MRALSCFTAVEFPQDPNVVGIKYWYLCPFHCVAVGDRALAPLGRHNRLQEGVIRAVTFAEDDEAPYPIYAIKRIHQILK